MKKKKFKIKISKFFVITISFIAFVFLTSMIYGLFATNTNGLLSSSITDYKWCNIIYIFFRYLPAGFATSYVIAWTCIFGAKSDGSRLRFSPAMFTRYRRVMIEGIIAVFFMSIGFEVFVPLMNQKMLYHKELPVLLREYKATANALYDNGRYEFANEYAMLAFDLDPTDKETRKILQKTELSSEKVDKSEEFKQKVVKNKIESMPSFLLNELNFGKTYVNLQKVDRLLPEEMTSYKLLLLAEECFSREEWFNAHYYSQIGLKMSEKNDINCLKLKNLASEAWNKISSVKMNGTSEDNKLFAKKLEGYSALMENDYFKAYYIFKNLSQTSKQISLDKDVQKYLQISQDNLQKMFFFTEETFKLEGFESARNVRFKIDLPDDSVLVIFIKGVTIASTKSEYIQYLRGLSIYKFSKDGECIYGTYTPYAKMSSISADILEESEKSYFGIDNSIKKLPILLLRSTDRNRSDLVVGPQVKIGKTHDFENGFFIFPMEFEDFEILKKVSAGIDTVSVSTLFNFTDKAKKYGYSEEIFAQYQLNRLFYPIWTLCLFILLGIISWHGRIPADSVFKFKWLLILPVLYVSLVFIYEEMVGLFNVINYQIVAIFGKSFSLAVAVVFYSLCMFVASVMFLGCRNTTEQNF